jgi:hypothetical protein
LLIRGVLIALSGFLFIFAPGVPMGLLRRYGRGFPREVLYWGMGIWLAALLPTYFLQSLIRQLVQGGGSVITSIQAGPTAYALSLVNTVLAAVLLVGGMAFYLWRKRLPEAERTEGGLTLGFGVGLISQVFTGLSLVGAGFRLTYGDTSEPGLAALANSPMLDLAVGLLAMILFRIALLTVSGVVGILVIRSIHGAGRLFWLAAGTYAAFSWLIVAAQLALGGENPATILAGQASLLTSGVTAAYYLAATALAYRWLREALSTDAVGSGGRGETSRRGN